MRYQKSGFLRVRQALCEIFHKLLPTIAAPADGDRPLLQARGDWPNAMLEGEAGDSNEVGSFTDRALCITAYPAAKRSSQA